MAVTALLVVLVISALMTTWYLMSDHSSKVARNLEVAANSAAAEKLYQLAEQSTNADVGTQFKSAEATINDHPLVTTVVNTLSEFNEDSLLYIYVVDAKSTTNFRDANLYTYQGYTIQNESSLNGGSGITGFGSHKTTYSITPTTDAVKQLLTYSQNRCHLTIVDVKNSGNNFIGVVVEVIT